MNKSTFIARVIPEEHSLVIPNKIYIIVIQTTYLQADVTYSTPV